MTGIPSSRPGPTDDVPGRDASGRVGHDPVAIGGRPGEVIAADGEIELNPDRRRITLRIENTGDRPVQIGSHIHLPDVNAALAFDRAAATGFRLDVPAGTGMRFEPGIARDVTLVELAGARRVPGIQVKEQTP